MSSDLNNLKIYANQECTQPISVIEWGNFVKVKLADGTEKIIPNTATGGETATATFWIRNEGEYDYGITHISFSDERVQVFLSESWIYPNKLIKITLTFPIPMRPTKKDVIQAGMIIIEGFYVFKSPM
jgi:hypothetical protein